MSEFSHTLTLLRHGRARAAEPGQADRERPLEEGSTEELSGIGINLMSIASPTSVLASSSFRTTRTAEIVAADAGVHGIEYLDDLYCAGAETIWTLAVGRTRAGDSVIVVGHNPGLSQLATRLAGVSVSLSPGGYASFGFREGPRLPADAVLAVEERPAREGGRANR